jgi:hypothetical protein
MAPVAFTKPATSLPLIRFLFHMDLQSLPSSKTLLKDGLPKENCVVLFTVFCSVIFIFNDVSCALHFDPIASTLESLDVGSKSHRYGEHSQR